MISKKVISTVPRLPLEGHLDLTYRCNNHCLHCWLWEEDGGQELTFDEIARIAGEARALGCRRWGISGGEPMLRPDFPEIFDLLTARATGYTLNTNGTLITPRIARLLKRRGTKLVALYGADAAVYDAVTRHPGGFEQVMQGFACLQEAGAGFIVQLIPLKANWHQWDRMLELARSLSAHYRVGAPWLYLSSCGSAERNREIAAQRLSPAQVIELDRPSPGSTERMAELNPEPACVTTAAGDPRLFARCIAARRDFHIDPYGQMSWCSFIKDPALRCDLRRSSVQEAWEQFIPACADRVCGDEEWRHHCASCAKRGDCRWCAVYAYLETGRYGAPVPHLCAVAEEAGRFKENWRKNHRRFFQIAGITVRLASDLDLSTVHFKEELEQFAVEGPGEDTITLNHHFDLPDLTGKDLGTEIYRKAPWVISRRNGTWFYRGISPTRGEEDLHRVAVFSADHRHGTIYHPPRTKEQVHKTGWPSLGLFPTDQIWLAPLLADRQAMILHAAGAVVNGQGLVFVGHSDAGKSTTMELLKSARQINSLSAEILCDDRIVLRRWPAGWQVHGTWSHGTTPEVSPAAAPLAAVLFLEQSPHNRLMPLTDRRLIWHSLLATLIRAAVSAEWWQKELNILEQLVTEAPCYRMQFDKTGAIVPALEALTE